MRPLKRKLRLSEIMRVRLSSNRTCVLIRRGRDTRDASTQRKSHVEDTEGSRLQAKQRGETKLLTPWSWTFSLRTVRSKFLLLKSLSRWYFVIAALANEYTPWLKLPLSYMEERVVRPVLLTADLDVHTWTSPYHAAIQGIILRRIGCYSTLTVYLIGHRMRDFYSGEDLLFIASQGITTALVISSLENKT